MFFTLGFVGIWTASLVFACPPPNFPSDIFTPFRPCQVIGVVGAGLRLRFDYLVLRVPLQVVCVAEKDPRERLNRLNGGREEQWSKGRRSVLAWLRHHWTPSLLRLPVIPAPLQTFPVDLSLH